MRNYVLGIHYPLEEQAIIRKEWLPYGLEFHFVNTLSDGIEHLRSRDYVCIVLYTDDVSQKYFDALRSTKDIPVVMLSPTCSMSQRIQAIHFGAAQYIVSTEQQQEAAGIDNLHYYLESSGQKKPLTVITAGELYFCLESRAVEIAGRRIELTEKEFDLLALMIMNPHQVFTYELIMEMVWKSDYAFYSRNAVSSHISNLRKKLKITPDAADYIRSVRGIGYKFEV